MSAVKLFEDLEEAGRDAAGALDRSERASLFDRLDWFRLVGEHLPDGEPLVIRADEEAGSVWLFLARDGSQAHGLTNWYSLRFGPVVQAMNGHAPSLDGLAKGLRKAGIGRVTLSPLIDPEPLAAALRRSGWMVRIGKASESWRIATKGMSFDDYWADRPSRLRNTARRKSKTPGLGIVIHDRFEADAWRDYEVVYAASWKPAEGAPALLRALAEQEGAAGTLRLGLAYLDGRPVAAHFWLIEDKTATIHKLAYAEDAKHCSPGTVLGMEMFRRALDVDRVETIDFGIGGDAYKAEWMNESEPLYAITAFDARSFAGLAAAAGAAAAKLVPALRSH